MKKLNIIKWILVGLMVLILIAIFLYLIITFVFNNNKDKDIKLESKIEKYGYILNNNSTSIYKDEFYKLKEILEPEEVRYEEYATSMSKLFVIDFFTLNNKVTKDDVGGVQFLYESYKDNFVLQSTNTIYKYVDSNIDGNRKQELPEVSTIEVLEVKESKIKINEIEYDGYLVNLEWTYKKDLGYQNIIKLKLIKEDNKLFVIEGLNE